MIGTYYQLSLADEDVGTDKTESNSIGSYRSQYITISSSFTDAFVPSSPHSRSIRLSLRRLCYRRCLIVGMFLAVAVAVTSL